MKNLFLGTIILLLSSCGWQLRNSQLVPEDFGSLHLSTVDSHSPLIQALTRALKASDIDLVDNTAGAAYSLVIVDVRKNRRTGTVNASARVAEYQLNVEVDFLITKPDGTPLTPLSTASVERSYEFSEQDILSSDTEERILRDSMHKEVVRQILNHLRAVANRASVPHGSKERIGQ